MKASRGSTGIVAILIEPEFWKNKEGGSSSLVRSQENLSIAPVTGLPLRS